MSTLVQASTFVLLARGIGVNSFGLLMIIQAFPQLAGDFVSLGAGDMLVRRVSRDPEQHGSAFGHALIMTAATSIAFAIILSEFAMFFYPSIGIIPIGIFMVGELSGNRLAALAEHVFIGHSLVNIANVVRLVPVTSKLISVTVTIYVLGVTSLADWMMVQGVVTLLTSLVCIGFTIIRLGMPAPIIEWSGLRLGTLLALANSAASVQYNIDRIVLGLVAPPSLVAVYTAATRGILAALIPIMAIMRNLYAGFFSVGVEGILATRSHAVANLPKVLLSAAITTIALILGADIYASLLGQGFEETAHILRWLSAIPLFRGIQLLLGDALTGSDHQVWRTSIEVAGAVGYIIAIAFFASSYGINGLIIAVNVYHVVITIAFLVAVRALESSEGANSI